MANIIQVDTGLENILLEMVDQSFNDRQNDWRVQIVGEDQ